MKGQELRTALRSGQRVYGTLICSNSPRWPVDGVAPLGLDFVFIDSEHVPLDRGQLSWMCRTYAAMGVAPIVRIPSPDPYWATMVVDGGAQGVIAPYLETPEQARRVGSAIKLRPLRGQRLERAASGQEPLSPELQEYTGTRNAGLSFIANIESIPAMEALDEILEIEYLDAVLVGPHDLSTSLGVPEQYEHPRFIAAVDEIFRKARVHGRGAGIHAVYTQAVQHEIRWAEMGANLIIHSADIYAFRRAMQADLAAIRGALGDLPGATPADPASRGGAI
jgi:2-keto-3-deoxy-L-rhamnonate aldolase RhmA